MYLLLFAVLLIVTNSTGSTVLQAAAPYYFVAVLAAEHVIAYLFARCLKGVAGLLVNLAILDFAAGAFVGFLLLDHYFVVGFFLALWGLILCVGTYHRQRPSYTGPLPLRGEWARRFRIGWGLLLMQAVSPSTLAAIAFVNGFWKPQPYLNAAVLQGIVFTWVLTLPLHFAPLYQRLVRGDRTNVPARSFSRITSQVPTPPSSGDQ